MNNALIHSAGPWEVRPGKQSGNFAVYAAGARASSGAICVCARTETKPVEANACLISAAPELLEAAKAAEAVLGRQKWREGSTDPEAVSLYKLREVIAKAEGRSSEGLS